MIVESEKELLFVDMDGVIFDYEGGAVELLGDNIAPVGSKEREEQINNCQHIPHFYRYLKPLPGAIDGYRRLCECGLYNVFILSAPSWDNPHSSADKRISAYEYLGDLVYKKIILTHDKGLYTGRALIDDRIKYGVDRFKGEHIHFGTSKFPNWEAVLKYLIPEK